MPEFSRIGDAFVRNQSVLAAALNADAKNKAVGATIYFDTGLELYIRDDRIEETLASYFFSADSTASEGAIHKTSETGK